LTLLKEDLPSFVLPTASEIDELLVDELITMRLQIISLSFKEDNKWKALLH
jgi:hypothetical protein